MKKPGLSPWACAAARREHVAGDLDSRFAQRRGTGAVDEWIRIGNGIDHARDARGNERGHARWRAALMSAGLQAHIGSRALGARAGRAQRLHLGVRFPGALMPALPDDLTVAHQHTADARIRVRAMQSECGQLERTAHVEHRLAHDLGLTLGASWPGSNGNWSSCASERLRRWCRRRSISSRNASTS